MEKVSARQILESRSVISREGKYVVDVTNVTYNHLRTTKSGETQLVNIVNFNAMTNYQATESLKHFKNGDFVAAVSSSLSASTLEGQFTPDKGERVEIEVESIYSEKANANILVVSKINRRKAEFSSKFKLNLDQEEEQLTTVEEESLV